MRGSGHTQHETSNVRISNDEKDVDDDIKNHSSDEIYFSSAPNIAGVVEAPKAVELLQVKASTREEKMRAVEAALEEQIQKEAKDKEDKAHYSSQQILKTAALEDEDEKRRLEAIHVAKEASSIAKKALDEHDEADIQAESIRRRELDRILQAEADARERKLEEARSERIA